MNPDINEILVIDDFAENRMTYDRLIASGRQVLCSRVRILAATERLGLIKARYLGGHLAV